MFEKLAVTVGAGELLGEEESVLMIAYTLSSIRTNGEKEKIVFNFGYQSSLCIASVKRKEVFFFQLFFDKWI